MKRLLQFSLMLLAFACVFTACSDDDDDTQSVISASSLPQAAKSFISQHFANETITLAKEDTPNYITQAKYYVYLTNGYEIDFDSTGKWVEVEVERGSVELPTSILALIPTTALEYVRTNYVSAKISSIQQIMINNQLRYEVGLNNNLEIRFNSDGQFISVDN